MFYFFNCPSYRTVSIAGKIVFYKEFKGPATVEFLIEKRVLVLIFPWIRHIARLERADYMVFFV